MKSNFFWGFLLGFVLLTASSSAQFVSNLEGNKLVIRNITGKFMVSGYYNGLEQIAQGENIVVLWYNSDKVEVRDINLKLVSSAFYRNLKNIGATQDYPILFYNNKKVEVRNRDLKLISSWYQ